MIDLFCVCIRIWSWGDLLRFASGRFHRQPSVSTRVLVLVLIPKILLMPFLSFWKTSSFPSVKCKTMAHNRWNWKLKLQTSPVPFCIEQHSIMSHYAFIRLRIALFAVSLISLACHISHLIWWHIFHTELKRVFFSCLIVSCCCFLCQWLSCQHSSHVKSNTVFWFIRRHASLILCKTQPNPYMGIVCCCPHVCEGARPEGIFGGHFLERIVIWNTWHLMGFCGFFVFVCCFQIRGCVGQCVSYTLIHYRVHSWLCVGH